jgi:hypothetical protein
MWHPQIKAKLFEQISQSRKGSTDANRQRNKYPPAQPGVLRLLPPQRGLIAIGESQNPRTVNVGVKHIA